MSSSNIASYNIFLVGEISSGKSSFINALCGYPQSCVSKQRETFNPLGFIFNEDNINNMKLNMTHMEELHNENRELRENINDIKLDDIKNIKWEKNHLIKIFEDIDKEMRIIDFPGINDAEDTNNLFMNCIKENIDMCDLIIFITDANRAFNSTSEIEHYNNIRDMVIQQKNKGKYVDLIVVVNKYDNDDIDNSDSEEDEDLIDIYERIQKKIDSNIYNIDNDKIFKFSSYKYFIERFKENKLNMTNIPKTYIREIKKIVKETYCWNDKIAKDIKNKCLNHENISYDLNDENNNKYEYKLIDYIHNSILKYNSASDEFIIKYLKKKFDEDNNFNIQHINELKRKNLTYSSFRLINIDNILNFNKKINDKNMLNKLLKYMIDNMFTLIGKFYESLLSYRTNIDNFNEWCRKNDSQSYNYNKISEHNYIRYCLSLNNGDIIKLIHNLLTVCKKLKLFPVNFKNILLYGHAELNNIRLTDTKNYYLKILKPIYDVLFIEYKINLTVEEIKLIEDYLTENIYFNKIIIMHNNEYYDNKKNIIIDKEKLNNSPYCVYNLLKNKNNVCRKFAYILQLIEIQEKNNNYIKYLDSHNLINRQILKEFKIDYYKFISYIYNNNNNSNNKIGTKIFSKDYEINEINEISDLQQCINDLYNYE